MPPSEPVAAPVAAPTSAVGVTSCARPSESQCLTELLRRVEAGQGVNLPEVVQLTQAANRPTRGLAKRLLAVLLAEQARRDAARLLSEACEDLSFRHPVLLAEALAHLRGLGQPEPIFKLQARAAQTAVQRRDYASALVYAQNAAAADFQLGSRCISDPDHLRMLIGVYERVARESAGPIGLVAARPGQRRSPANGKLRLAHVVGQLVDGGHAPSRVAHALLKFADRERFDHYLVITEALAQHAQQPAQALVSDTSDRRAPRLIAYLQNELGVPVLRPRTLDTFVAAAADLHRQLAEHAIDIAFFHGSIATPTDWLLCAWQAAPWQFDRGFGIPLYCPAVDYQFFELDPVSMEKLAVLCRERGVRYGLSPNGSVDLSKVETAEPIPRTALGVPEDHVVLGTVGNHLPKRMSPQFCRTVAGVLRTHPQTTYLVVGPGPFDQQVAAFGSDLVAGPSAGETGNPRAMNVGNSAGGARVRFVGPTHEAERWTLTFDIYLNEYPGGGGISVCEAIAAGKPVVCMQADDSMLAAAGAVYVGPEHLVRPATDAAYAQRMVEFITGPAQRRALGRIMRQRYEQHFDPRGFVAQLTEHVWQVVTADTAAAPRVSRAPASGR